jgi:universal stress protein A
MKFKPAKKADGLPAEPSPCEQEFPFQAEAARAARLNLKQILVALDFSEGCRKAVDYGAALARHFGARATLIFVLQPHLPMLELAEIDPAAGAVLEDLRRSFEPLVRSETILRRGEPYVEIVRAARDLKADLIVLSGQRASGVFGALIGSTAEKVVRHASCPVLVVPESERELALPEPLTDDGRTVRPII